MKLKQMTVAVVFIAASSNVAAYNTGRELAADLESPDRAASAAVEYWINGVVNGVMMATKYKYRCVRFPKHRDAVRKYLAEHPELMTSDVPEGIVVTALWTAGLCPVPTRIFLDASASSRLSVEELQKYNQQIELEHECLLAEGKWFGGRCLK